MKHLTWGLALLAVLLGVCALAAGRLSAHCARMEALLEQAAAAARKGDAAAAEALTAEARDCWAASIPFVDAVTCHEETDELTRALAELSVHAARGRWDEFLSLCARAAAQAAHLRQMEQLRWYNLLSVPRAGASCAQNTGDPKTQGRSPDRPAAQSACSSPTASDPGTVPFLLF